MKIKEVIKLLEVKDLFVGTLGYVTVTDEGWHISKSDKYIIFKKKKFDSLDYCAENIFTNQTYFFFHGNTCLYNTVNKAANSYAVYSSIPLEHFIDAPKMEVSREELLELFWKLNKRVENNDDVQDNILKMILQTSEMVKFSEFDYELKKNLLKELEELGNYYVNSMIFLLQSNQEKMILDEKNEYSIGMECMKRLVEIESKFRNLKVAKSYSLKRQFG